MPTLSADEWTDNYDDPAWVRRQLPALRALDFDPPTSLARLGAWLDRKKGVVTAALEDGGDE